MSIRHNIVMALNNAMLVFQNYLDRWIHRWVHNMFLQPRKMLFYVKIYPLKQRRRYLVSWILVGFCETPYLMVNGDLEPQPYLIHLTISRHWVSVSHRRDNLRLTIFHAQMSFTRKHELLQSFQRLDYMYILYFNLISRHGINTCIRLWF
jgi:hypothetical protein